jgi:hypothetical protein
VKLYLASAFSRQSELRQYAYTLRFAGYEVTSRWLTQEATDKQMGHDAKANAATNDLEDILAADTLVRFSDPEFFKEGKVPKGLLSGSRMVETGAALMRGIRVIVVGGAQSVFDSLPQVIHVKDFAELMRWLRMFHPAN